MMKWLIVWLIVFSGLPAMAQTRHALVVGIDAYSELPSLDKAVADARTIADVLGQAGFEVAAGYDLDRRGLVKLVSGFVGKLQPEDEVMVFYAGHAVEINRQNYLVPSDATAVDQSNEAQVIAESIGQDFLLNQITGRDVRLTVVVMDACRDNPFEGLQVRGTSAARGLAIENPPRGVFLLFSADEGQQALDGLGPDDTHPNSVFTRTLVPLLQEPGLDIVEVSRRLRGDVEGLANRLNHVQFPVYRDRMRGDGKFVITPAVAGGVASSPPAQSDPCATARADWTQIGAGYSRESIKAFISAYSACPVQVAVAEERLRALTKQGLQLVSSIEFSTGEENLLIGHFDVVQSAAFSSDGRRIVTASRDLTARIWDASTASEIGSLWGHRNFLSDAAFSPDGRQIVTASLDHTARIWDAESENEIVTLGGHEGSVNSAAFSPDGRRVVTASEDNTARIWDSESGREIIVLSGHRGSVKSADFSPDGRKIVTASEDNTARVWDAESGREIATLRGHEDSVYSAAFSPDGRRIVTASRDWTAIIWDAEVEREIAKLEGHDDSVYSAAFSSDGRRIVTASEDKTARVWNGENGAPIAELVGHKGPVSSAVFSPDGRRIVAPSVNTYHFVLSWDAP